VHSIYFARFVGKVIFVGVLEQIKFTNYHKYIDFIFPVQSEQDNTKWRDYTCHYYVSVCDFYAHTKTWMKFQTEYLY
jgi:hypothetical protein